MTTAGKELNGAKQGKPNEDPRLLSESHKPHPGAWFKRLWHMQTRRRRRPYRELDLELNRQ